RVSWAVRYVRGMVMTERVADETRRGRRGVWLALVTGVALLGVTAPAQGSSFVYVTNLGFGFGSSISQYSAGSGGLLSPLSPPTVGTGRAPGGVAVSPDARSVYVVNGD